MPDAVQESVAQMHVIKLLLACWIHEIQQESRLDTLFVCSAALALYKRSLNFKSHSKTLYRSLNSAQQSGTESDAKVTHPSFSAESKIANRWTHIDHM